MHPAITAAHVNFCFQVHFPRDNAIFVGVRETSTAARCAKVLYDGQIGGDGACRGGLIGAARIKGWSFRTGLTGGDEKMRSGM